ncbi:hypothetical protein RND71_033196 [Anisodus tanguticus]|uniref:AB hydrolase-1 domain-containing protein n=1 Tax=Anisodus tanguticus TaxID=243964 RepID=A0AAE1R9U3_9SOLA|nr:hypothetical protein RND71_033196 [Anisodus tanguticus]
MSTFCTTARTEWLNPIVTGDRLELNRRNLTVNRIAASGMTPSVVAESSRGLQQLPFKPEGYNYWTWRGYKIHNVEEGEGFPIVLVHGFASSSFHWRYNIPQLAKKYKVYAVDFLGFGWSEKARIDNDALIWRDQVVYFLREIVKQPAVLVGNSLGGFTTLLAAAALPDQIKGVSLLNSAGRFGNDIGTTDKTEETALHKFIVKPVEEIFQRVAFWLTMQPDHIEGQLKSGTVKATHVKPNKVYSVLNQFSCPLLLLWGDLDPWVHDHAKPNRIKDFYPNTSLVNLQAGHYPHDEVPEQVNKALLDWLSTLDVLSFDLGKKLEERISVLANELALWLSESVKDGRERCLIFHTFSNTGWLAYGAILDNLKSRQDLLEKVKGCVVDSGGDPNVSPKVWAAGFTAAVLKKHSSFAYSSVEAGEGNEVGSPLTAENIQIKGAMLIETVIFAAFEKLFSFLLIYLMRLTKILSVLFKNQPSCPQLYLYSTADKVIPFHSVESFIEEQRKSGREVHSFNFGSSPHDHYRTFPFNYVSVLQKFLQECMLIPNGVHKVKGQPHQ